MATLRLPGVSVSEAAVPAVVSWGVTFPPPRVFVIQDDLRVMRLAGKGLELPDCGVPLSHLLVFAAVCRPHTGGPGVAAGGSGVQQVLRADGDDAGSPLLDRHHQAVLASRHLGGPGGGLQGGLAA